MGLKQSSVLRTHKLVLLGPGGGRGPLMIGSLLSGERSVDHLMHLNEGMIDDDVRRF